MTTDLRWTTQADDRLECLEEVVSFLQRDFGVIGGVPTWTADYMRWKLGPSNPAGCGYMSIARCDGKVVGVVTLTRKRILVDGHEAVGGEVGDTYTSATFRRSGAPALMSPLDADPQSYVNKSIFGRLASEVFSRATADGVTIVYGTPNKNAFPGWTKRLGYGVVRNENYYCFSRPTARYFVRRFPWLGVIAPLLVFADRGLIRAQLMAMSFRAPHLDVSEELSSDDEIDRLWYSTRPQEGFSLVRDSRYWRHRYRDNPLCQYTLKSFRKNGALVGVVAMRETSQPGENKRVLSLIEWMAQPPLSFSHLALLAFQDKVEGSEPPDVINFWASREMTGRDAKRLFFSRRTHIPVILGPNSFGHTAASLSRFSFHIGSSDAL